jgi:hypothetical protein
MFHFALALLICVLRKFHCGARPQSQQAAKRFERGHGSSVADWELRVTLNNHDAEPAIRIVHCAP